MMRLLAVLVMLLTGLPRIAAPMVGPEPVDVVTGFVRAWNTHDMSAFRKLFADDVTWVAVAESRLEGRTAVLKEFAEIHGSWARTTTVRASDVKVQQVRPDVAVVFFHLHYFDAAGHQVPGVDRAMILVATRQPDGWHVSAGQLTKQSPSPTATPARLSSQRGWPLSGEAITLAP